MSTSHIACAALLVVSLTASASAQEGTGKISVEVQFATEIEDRRPVDASDAFEPGKVYCWTRVKGGSGNFRLVHVWIRDDRVIHRQSVRVRGSSWTTWTHHNVTPGRWKVQIEDSNGEVLAQGSFSVAAAQTETRPLQRHAPQTRARDVTRP